MNIIVDGGIVNCVDGVRVWALIDGREVLILIGKVNICQEKMKNENAE